MSTPTTIEHLPTNIPYLETDGSNWAIFVLCFQEAIQATQRWSYFEGLSPRPTPADPNNATDTEKKEIEKWDQEDTTARSLLS